MSAERIVFDTPVFSVDYAGRFVQLISFNVKTKAFKAVRMDNGDLYQQTQPISAMDIYLNLPDRGPRNGELRALRYLLDLGVSNIKDIPTNFIQKKPTIAVQALLSALDMVSGQPITEVTYIEEFDDYFILDNELTQLCNLVVCPYGKPKHAIVETLCSYGYPTHPVSERFGWDIAVIETINGKVLFG